MSDVGREIRRLREARGWGQTKLAAAADMAVSGVSQIENGHRNPNSATLIKLARALEVEARDLFPLGQAPLPLEAERALEASDEEFAEMVAGADEGSLAAMKRTLKDHLPRGGTNPPRPTHRQLVAMHRWIAIRNEQKQRLDAEEQVQDEIEAAIPA